MLIEVMKQSDQFGFVVVPAGDFVMGSNEGHHYQNETPLHLVRIKAFEMGKYPVTEYIWDLAMSPTPSGGFDKPKTEVSWDTIQVFIAKLNEADPGHNYRLPSESEWEYAARAGTTEERYGPVDDVAWYNQNSGHIQSVGKKVPNAFGLYDMLGNVSEWVQDWYHDSYDGAPCNGSAWEAPKGNCRVYRGGEWLFDAAYVRASIRYGATPESSRHKNLGFRLVRDASKATEVPVEPDLTDIPALIKEVKALRKEIKSIWNLLDKRLGHE